MQQAACIQCLWSLAGRCVYIGANDASCTANLRLQTWSKLSQAAASLRLCNHTLLAHLTGGVRQQGRRRKVHRRRQHSHQQREVWPAGHRHFVVDGALLAEGHEGRDLHSFPRQERCHGVAVHHCVQCSCWRDGSGCVLAARRWRRAAPLLGLQRNALRRFVMQLIRRQSIAMISAACWPCQPAAPDGS